MRNYQTKQNKGALPDSINAERFGSGEFNSLAVENKNAVLASGQSVAPADGAGEINNQLAIAQAIYSAAGKFYAESGVANAYVLSPISPRVAPDAYYDGMEIVFDAGNNNTGASTVNVDSIGIKDIVMPDGNPTPADTINGRVKASFDLGNDRFVLISTAEAVSFDDSAVSITATNVQEAIVQTLLASGGALLDSLIVSNWDSRPNPKSFDLKGVIWSAGGTTIHFVAVGQADGTDSYIVVSQTGFSWTERANPKNVTLNKIVFAQSLDLNVAVGEGDGVDAYIVTADSGAVVWTERANPKNFALRDVSWDGTNFVAVGDPDGTDAYLITSPDGINWTERANPKNFLLFGVDNNGGALWVAVGNADGTDAYIITATDPTGTWTERSNPKNVLLRTVKYCGPSIGWVAAGDSDGADTYLVTSPDGVTWTEQTVPINFSITQLDYNGEYVIGVGATTGGKGPAIIFSRDGITWQKGRIDENLVLQDVVWDGECWIAVGDENTTQGAIWQSLRL